MSRTLQIRVDDFIKNAADELFCKLGLDTSTAIRIFLNIAIETGGIPFEIKLPDNSLSAARNDVLNKTNLSKRYKSAQEAIDAMLEDE